MDKKKILVVDKAFIDKESEKALVVDKDLVDKITWLPGTIEQFFPTDKYQVKVVNIRPEVLDFLYVNPDTSVVFLDYRNYNEVDYANIREIIQHIRCTDEIKHVSVVTIVSMSDDRLQRGVLKNGSDFIVYKETLKMTEAEKMPDNTHGISSAKIFNYMLDHFSELSTLRKKQNQQ